MTRSFRILALAIGWGALSGTLAGVSRIVSDGYADAGLLALSTRTILEAVRDYLVPSLLGGLVGIVLSLGASALDRRARADHGLLTRMLPWLCVSIPSWACVALHDRWLLPSGRGPGLGALAALLALHVRLTCWVLARRSRGDRAGTPVRTWVLATLAAVWVAALFGGRQARALSPER